MTEGLEGWMEAALVSMAETAETFGFGAYELFERSGAAPPQLAGSSISIAGDVSRVQVGILAEPSDQELVARVMLDIADDPITLEDREDAMRELANIIAGGIKRGMYEFDSGLTLGLPIFIEGSMDYGGNVITDVARLMLGAAKLNLVVTYEPKSIADLEQ